MTILAKKTYFERCGDDGNRKTNGWQSFETLRIFHHLPSWGKETEIEIREVLGYDYSGDVSSNEVAFYDITEQYKPETKPDHYFRGPLKKLPSNGDHGN